VRRFALVALTATLALAVLSPPLASAQPDSQPGVDAPELARFGPSSVGVRSIRLVERDTPDVLACDRKTGAAPARDRILVVDVWYPTRASGPPILYAGALPSETPGEYARFSIRGAAIEGAAPDLSHVHPLVVLSHGYSGSPVAMSWLAENLASKGYVVAAPHHDDPQITNAAKFAGPLFLRPLDDAFTAHALQKMARSGDPLFAKLVDPDKVALIGYSMGGYGVLTVAGAGVSKQAAAAVPGGYLSPYANGGEKRAALQVQGLKAVVAISPFGGRGSPLVFTPASMIGLRVPTMFIVGSQDGVVGYSPGVKTLFDEAVNAPRYLLVFREGGHSIGMDGAPATMRNKLWDFDWFEDPVWRKTRVEGVQLHMITAFLDLYVKGDKSREAYLNVIPNGDDGVWPDPPGAPYGAYSSGGDGVTLWKGFQRSHAVGLELHYLAPLAP
jgi:predicted dienelactone hydrolase